VHICNIKLTHCHILTTLRLLFSTLATLMAVKRDRMKIKAFRTCNLAFYGICART